MAGHEEILLQQILKNQDNHEEKLDGLRNAVQEVRDNLGTTENRIMLNVRKEFVRQEEFPRLWVGQMECRQKKSLEKFETSTRFATHIKTWLGWGAAIVLFIASQGDKISGIFGR